jgi:kynureninase
MDFNTDKEFAAGLDASDPLAAYRDKFYVPKYTGGSDVIYFAGNSLGLQPKTARGYIEQELDDWQRLAVEGHMHAKHPWLPYHEYLAANTAELVGANPEEVVCMNTLSVNLHLMMVSFYRPTEKRYKILIETNTFPSDHYAVQSQIRFHGYDPATALIEMKPRKGEDVIRTEDIEEFITKEGDSIALILFAGVNYYTGQAFEYERITKAGHAKGCSVGFDMAHGTGNLPLKLHDWDVDFAVWCSYKYLNAGPGAIAGAFIHEKHIKDSAIPKFLGWWGHDKATRFLMDSKYIPIPTAESWQLSNPPIFQLAALRASMDIFHEAGMENLRRKSELLTGYLEFLIKEKCADNIVIITPANPAERGCQLSLRAKKNGKAIHEYLNTNGVVCDWREPDVIRAAPVPLYNTFMDVWNFVEILSRAESFGS